MRAENEQLQCSARKEAKSVAVPNSIFDKNNIALSFCNNQKVWATVLPVQQYFNINNPALVSLVHDKLNK